MGYTALYRKFRPQNFDEVIGQQHIVQTLKNQIKIDRINHAYLFCGTRGTGKTSTAKIFAKVLNCELQMNGTACHKCEICLAFDENRSLNIIEIDAASNNGVDDIRDIREEVKYPPTKGKYKVYIIDEVHMLSIGAFNALLKTLEEPPSHIIFILATTDAHKIPVTILSRCQRFDFKRIGMTDMAGAIKKYMEQENVSIQDDAIDYIVKVSDGAMRDALSVLDQCISLYYDENITLHKVLDVVGSVDDKIFFELTGCITSFNSLGAINVIDDLVQNGRDITQFISDVIGHFRNLIIAKMSDDNTLNVTEDKFLNLKAQANSIDINYLLKIINEFSDMQSTLKYSFDERIVLETMCIRLCSAIDDKDITDIIEKVKLLENKIQHSEKQIVYVEPEKEKEPELRELAVAQDIKNVIDNYDEFVQSFDNATRPFIEKAKVKSLEDEYLYIVGNVGIFDNLKNKEEIIIKKLGDMFGKLYKVRILDDEQYKKNYKEIANSLPKITTEIDIKDIENTIQINMNVDRV